MILPLVGKLSMKSMVTGGVLTAFAAAVARPLLVGTFRVGYEASEAVKDAWSTAKVEVDKVKAEAKTPRK
jgi:hypothetical protein